MLKMKMIKIKVNEKEKENDKEKINEKVNETVNESETIKMPFNVVLLGNIETENYSLLHKLIKKRMIVKQLKELKNSEENGEEDSNIDEVMNSVEIHGETVKMKIWDNVSANKLFSPSNKCLKVAQGIILFYSVSNRESFKLLKLSLTNLIDLDKYDIPMIMVGYDSETQKREVTYEEGKALADSYGIRFYESSVFKGLEAVLEDIGEQVVYHKYRSRHTNRSKSRRKKNKNLSTCRSTKTINKNLLLLSNVELYQNSTSKKQNNIRGKNISIFSLRKDKRKNSYDENDNNNKNKSNLELDLDESNTSNLNTSSKKRRNRNDFIFKSPDVTDSSLLHQSSSIIFSYLGKTTAQKKREEEVRERRLKREKEMKSWWKQREKKNLERLKRKKQKEKEEQQKRIKEHKINQKEEEKKAFEENYLKIKSNYEQRKKYNKEIEKEIILGKENKRMEKLLEKRSNKEKLNKLKEEKEKEKEKEAKLLHNNRNNLTIKKNLSSNKKTSNLSKNKSNIYNNKLRSKNKSKKNKKVKIKENNQEDDNLAESIKAAKEEEIFKQNLEKKNLLLENYQKNSNIYRCLKCRLIPNIIINEYNQEVEAFCDKSFCDKSHHNITTYSNFHELSLNHPIDNISTPCYYCNKVINELPQGQIMYNCSTCDIYFCAEDEETHNNDRHKNEENKKLQYLQISNNKNKPNNKKDIKDTSLQKKKNKKFNKQMSSPNISKKKYSKSSTSKTKKDVKKLNRENKNKINIISINNNTNDVIPPDKNEKNKINNFNKIQIYLIDSNCDIHNEIYNAYCFNCHQNICWLCEKGHIDHNTIKFEEIFLEDEKLIEKKNELNKAKEELAKINDCFNALMEEIKTKYETLFNIKKKELEIKEKIIIDYETIKYNYHCINNIKNLKIERNKNYLDESKNTNWFHRFDFINI